MIIYVKNAVCVMISIGNTHRVPAQGTRMMTGGMNSSACIGDTPMMNVLYEEE